MDVAEFLSELDSAQRRIRIVELDGPLVEAGKQFGKEVADNFQRQVGSDGSVWPPHATLTVKLHGPHPLLRLSYRMYRAATDLNDSAAKKVLSRRSITLGINGDEIPYAAVQDQGGGRIPQREFFYLSEDGQERVREVIEEAAYPIVVERVLP